MTAERIGMSVVGFVRFIPSLLSARVEENPRFSGLFPDFDPTQSYRRDGQRKEAILSTDEEPLDRQHLFEHAHALFPCAKIEVIHSPDEVIHIDVNGHRFTFEVGSDDDEYAFTDGYTWFAIPLFLDPPGITPDGLRASVLIDPLFTTKGTMT